MINKAELALKMKEELSGREHMIIDVLIETAWSNYELGLRVLAITKDVQEYKRQIANMRLRGL